MDVVEKVAWAICRNSSHAPNGTCAAICMDELGDVPAGDCRHAKRIHGKKALAAVKICEEYFKQQEPDKTCRYPGCVNYSPEADDYCCNGCSWDHTSAQDMELTE